jgi:hypothetical protein
MKTVKMKLGNGYVDVSVPEENFWDDCQRSPSVREDEEEVFCALANHRTPD